jgi:FkbM family methyltransferase
MRLHPAFCTQNWETVELESYRAFANAVKPGAVIFDIGAHIGTYTLLALAKAGHTGRVVAYEPHDYTREHLLRHLEWNAAATRTIVRDVCCGASDGFAELYFVPGQAEGMTGLLPVKGFEKRLAEVVTLDSEIEKLAIAPDLIKIDVEGTEWDVLKGAEQTLKQRWPVVFLSLHPRALATRNETPDQVLDWLRDLGYSEEVIAVDHEVHVVARRKASA